jgi:hypothetical protein
LIKHLPPSVFLTLSRNEARCFSQLRERSAPAAKHFVAGTLALSGSVINVVVCGQLAKFFLQCPVLVNQLFSVESPVPRHARFAESID